MYFDLKERILSDTDIIVFESSLQNLCMNVLMEQLQSNEDFAANWRGRLINLPSWLRREMLKKMELGGVEKRDWEEMEKASETALALMCSQIPTFDFECIESSGDPFLRRKGKQQQVINKTYKLLAERHSASLQELVHVYKPAMRLTKRHDKRERIAPFSIRRFGSVLRLTNLRCLHLTEYSISQQQFKILCQTLVNLQNLSCNLLDVKEKQVSAALKNLTKLEEFEFSTSYIQETPEPSKLCSNLLDKFPKLKVIGPRVNRLSFTSNSRERQECHSLENIRTWKEPSQLEHLSINQTFTLEQARQVPNVKALRVTARKCSFKYGFGVEAVMMLSELKSLTVEGGNHHWGSLLQIFEQIGPRLEEVTFDNADPAYHEIDCDGQLLSFCPNIKTLNTSHIPEEVTLVNFDHLTKIFIKGSYKSYCPSGFSLCLIFSPPRLEVVELWDLYIEEEELQDAVHIMSSPGADCSRQLREIRGSIGYENLKEILQPDEYVQDLWDLFFLDVCTHSPKLQVFDFRRGTTNLIGWLTKTMLQRSMTVE